MEQNNYPIFQTAKAELLAEELAIKELTSKLGEREKRREKLHAFIEAYKELFGAPLTENPSQGLGLVLPDGSDKAKIIAISEYSLLKKSPRNTLELLSIIENEYKITVGGGNKAVYLANILSTSDKFVARRKFGGWFLVSQDPDPKKAENPSVTSTEASMFNQNALAGT
jgi:hypothetical protein